MENAKKTSARKINTWVQTVGIFLAAAWGVYTFVYKEIMLPRSAPVNISVNLQLKKIGTPTSGPEHKKGSLVAIEMRVSATNPSSREVYLLPSAWIAYGLSVDSVSHSAAFAKNAISSLNSHEASYYEEKHATVSEASVVAVGNLFVDDSLKPNETVTRTLVFHVPPGRYDWLDVQAVMPTVARKTSVGLEWKFDQESGLVPTLYHVNGSGERTEMAKSENGEYLVGNIELQQARSMSALSLW
jgi:hypothetical protein